MTMVVVSLFIALAFPGSTRERINFVVFLFWMGVLVLALGGAVVFLLREKSN